MKIYNNKSTNGSKVIHWPEWGYILYVVMSFLRLFWLAAGSCLSLSRILLCLMDVMSSEASDLTCYLRICHFQPDTELTLHFCDRIVTATHSTSGRWYFSHFDQMFFFPMHCSFIIKEINWKSRNELLPLKIINDIIWLVYLSTVAF